MGYFGSSALSDIKFGSSAVSKVYRGSSLLWTAGGSFTGFQTGFESGDTLLSIKTNGNVSTGRAYDGTQSWLQNNSTSVAAQGEELVTGLPTNLQYEGFSLWVYNAGGTLIDGTGNYRVALGGSCTDFYVDGWGVYTRTNGFSVCSQSFFEEVTSSVTNISADTWHHYYIQLDWGAPAATRTTVIPSFSIWVDGTLAVNQFTPTALPAMGTPSNGFDTWALTGSLSSTTTGVDRNYDKLIANTSNTIIVNPASGNTTPAAIEAALLAF